MKFQLLPSTFEQNGAASNRQHLSCFIVNDSVSIDAGSLAMATSDEQKQKIRDVILTHAHLDHIAGLPLYIDDLFASLTEPIRVHATKEVVEVLERDIFNWSVYPRFSELTSENGAVMQYQPFEVEKDFSIKNLSIKAINVNHKVPTVGLIVSDERTTFAMTGDTAEMDKFWECVNNEKDLNAVLIECAFPDELDDLAHISHHLTPKSLQTELAKCNHRGCSIFIINIKPMYREQIVRQIEKLKIPNLEILEVGKVYQW